MSNHLLQCLEAGSLILLFGIVLGKALKKLGE